MVRRYVWDVFLGIPLLLVSGPVVAQPPAAGLWSCQTSYGQAPASAFARASPCTLTSPSVRVPQDSSLADARLPSIIGSALGLSLGVGMLELAPGTRACDDCSSSVLGSVLMIVGPITGAAIGAHIAGRPRRATVGSVLGFVVSGLMSGVLGAATESWIPAAVFFPVGHGLFTAEFARPGEATAAPTP
jgi:hypothetical protein